MQSLLSGGIVTNVPSTDADRPRELLEAGREVLETEIRRSGEPAGNNE